MEFKTFVKIDTIDSSNVLVLWNRINPRIVERNSSIPVKETSIVAAAAADELTTEKPRRKEDNKVTDKRILIKRKMIINISQPLF